MVTQFIQLQITNFNDLYNICGQLFVDTLFRSILYYLEGFDHRIFILGSNYNLLFTLYLLIEILRWVVLSTYTILLPPFIYIFTQSITVYFAEPIVDSQFCDKEINSHWSHPKSNSFSSKISVLNFFPNLCVPI